MQVLRDRMAQVSSGGRLPVLITGETGVGKELVARGIHLLSPRAGVEAVAINVGGVAGSLLESEFFGHERGAFTGALKTRKGFFEAANDSTLILDEIGELPLPLQAKLLRVLEDPKIRRIGGGEVAINVRIIASTNRDLEAMVRNGQFRMDLLFRLNVLPVSVPPLRERTEDIPDLIEHFRSLLSEEVGRKVPGFTHRAIDLLSAYAWPGNVRELRNLVARAAVRRWGSEIDLHRVKELMEEGTSELGGPALQTLRAGTNSAVDAGSDQGVKTVQGAVRRYRALSDPVAERERLVVALRGEGTKRAAARALGCSRSTIYALISRYSVEDAEWR
jgi:transcriptional regulator with GAF, ATPase, and Fis domain